MFDMDMELQGREEGMETEQAVETTALQDGDQAQEGQSPFLQEDEAGEIPDGEDGAVPGAEEVGELPEEWPPGESTAIDGGNSEEEAEPGEGESPGDDAGEEPQEETAPEHEESPGEGEADEGLADEAEKEAEKQDKAARPVKTPRKKPATATPRRRAAAKPKEEVPADEAEDPAQAVEPAPRVSRAPRSRPEPEDEVDKQERTLAQRKREQAAQRQLWRRGREKNAVLDVDGTSLLDDSEGFDEKAALVYQAKNTRSICCGPITGVKFSRGAGHYVEAEYNGFRVLIPFAEMDITLERQRSDTDQDHENKTITAIRNMVGAEVEFIILNIDEREELASASRRLATEQRRRDILNGTARNGEYYIYAGRKVVARVLDVHPFYAWVEIAGWRTRLSASELRAEYVEDMTTELANGQRITVNIVEVTRDKSGNVTDMRVSMRDDEKEKRDLEKAMAGINIGDIIRCEVTGRTNKVIRLKTHNGARAFCYIAQGLHGRYIPKIDEAVTIKVIRKTVNPRTGNPVLQGNILRRSVKPGIL